MMASMLQTKATRFASKLRQIFKDRVLAQTGFGIIEESARASLSILSGLCFISASTGYVAVLFVDCQFSSSGVLLPFKVRVGGNDITFD